MQNKSNFVSYLPFGAVGDGKTNDFAAIKAAHEYANENRLAVVAEGDKTFLIRETQIDGKTEQIVIKTDTDWNGATIIIDDTDISVEDTDMRSAHIFLIAPDNEPFILTGEDIASVGEIKRGKTTKIDLGLGYPAMIFPTNRDKRIYVRYGANANSGAAKREPVLIDKDGNIDESTPLMYDHDSLTEIKVVRADERAITVKNGNIITRASRQNTTGPDGTKKRGYFDRGIEIKRSNTTLSNIKHTVTGEFTPEEQENGYTGPAYHGIFTVNTSHNVTIADCVIPARRYYRISGTYGFNAYDSNAVTLRNCTQPNFYKADGVTLSFAGQEYWGVGAVNYTKNLVYDGCVLTRFDAHAGLGGGKILNSKVGMINLIGGGEMLIENTEIEYPDRIFALRSDYGSTWNGQVTIRNCKVTTSKNSFQLCTMLWTNHNFGYVCHFPNITVENLSFTNGNLPVKVYAPMVRQDPNTRNIYSEPKIDEAITSRGEENKNPYMPPEFLRVLKNDHGVEFYAEDIPFFKNTEIEGFERISLEKVKEKFI